MGKLYTLDGKLLTETPEIRIGEKVYPVDSRQKTVKKILALADDESVPMGERIDEALKLALGDENAVEIVPFPVSWTVKMKKKQKETQDILSRCV